MLLTEEEKMKGITEKVQKIAGKKKISKKQQGTIQKKIRSQIISNLSLEKLYAAETFEKIRQKKDVTVEEWFLFWLYQYKIFTVKSGTIESYKCIYEYYVKPVFGEQKLTKISGEEIQLFYNQIARQGYSNATLSLIHVLVGSMFKQAYKNGRVKKNPLEQVVLPKIEKEKHCRVLTIKEQKILLNYCKGSEIEGIILVAIMTGMRIGEIIGLEWNDINFFKQEIEVNGTLKQTRDGKFFKDIPKTKASFRTIPMILPTQKILQQIKEVQYYSKTVQKKTWNPILGLEQLVFTRQNGTPFTGQHIRQQLNRIVKKINEEYPELGFRYITPHILRHTFATRALENGIPPKVVQELLGHSSIKITLDLYTHILPKTKANEMKKIEHLFFETETRKFV